jgi:hypothetical protein
MQGKSRSNQTVIDSWKLGTSWRNGSGSLYTDGSSLWSYSLVIGFTTLNGYNADFKKIAIDYMAPDNVTQTTSMHVSLAKSVADEIVSPDSSKLAVIRSKVRG